MIAEETSPKVFRIQTKWTKRAKESSFSGPSQFQHRFSQVTHSTGVLTICSFQVFQCFDSFIKSLTLFWEACLLSLFWDSAGNIWTFDVLEGGWKYDMELPEGDQQRWSEWTMDFCVTCNAIPFGSSTLSFDLYNSWFQTEVQIPRQDHV